LTTDADGFAANLRVPAQTTGRCPTTKSDLQTDLGTQTINRNEL
jgi:hypothetical protein